MRMYLILLIGLISCTNHKPIKNIDNEQLKNTLFHVCDGLPDNAKDYFKAIKFPYYSIDSLTDETFSEDGYRDFEKCDDSIFQNKSNQAHYKYISLQDSIDFFSIIAYHQLDGENYVGLYIIDKQYHLKSSEVLFHPYGGSFDFPSDFKYNDTIVNFFKEAKKVFSQAKQYKVVLTEYYKLKDLKGFEHIDIGKQTIRLFNISSNGMIVKIEEKAFEKPYVTAIWKAI